MRRLILLSSALLVAAAVAFVSAAPQQATPPPPAPVATGLVVGRVLDGRTNAPISSAVVTLAPNNAGGRRGAPGAPQPQRVLSDADGYFLFTRVAKGSYSMSADKPGIGTGAFGRKQPHGYPATLDVADGERVGNITIPFWSRAAISGTVLDEAGDPVVGAIVTVCAHSSIADASQFTAQFAAYTDDRGTFRITGLQPGDYIVAVPQSRATFPGDVVEGLTSAGRTVDSAARRGALDLTRVIAMPGQPDADRAGDLVTKAVGHSLPSPGRDASGRMMIYPTTFYPGTDSVSSATVISVDSGEERHGVDIRLHPSPTSRVSGRVVGPDGPGAYMPMRLIRTGADVEVSSSDDLSFATSMTLSDAGGAFTFVAVPPGEYSVRIMRVPPLDRAIPMPQTVIESSQGTTVVPGSVSTNGPPPPSSAPTLWAEQALSIGDRDVTNLVVTVRNGFRVSGRIASDDASLFNATLSPLCSFQFLSVDGPSRASLPSAFAQRDGTFATWSAPGGRYQLLVQCNLPNLSLKSAMHDGHDLTVEPFVLDRDITDVVVTLTGRPAQLTGTVRTAAGAVDDAAIVRMFPVDRASWSTFTANPRRLQEARTDRTGVFSMPSFSQLGLPAGDYFIVALSDAATAFTYSIEAFDKLSRVATRISIGDGEKKSIDLTTTVIK